MHHLLSDMKSHWRTLRISSRQPPKQFLLRHIQEVNFATGPELLGPRAIVFSFSTRPKAEIEDHIRSQHERTARHLPKQGFDETMPDVVLGVFCILPEETQLPFIRREAKRRALMFELPRQSRFS